MKTKNALTVSPVSGLSELKRAKSLIRLTESILGKSIAPARNRTDEQGRKQGHWVERDADGIVAEGTFVDGKRHGDWVTRFADGTVIEAPYVDGKRHGDCVVRYAYGLVWKGPYKDDKQHGMGVWRFVNGDA